jgi:chromosome segregation ATPase
MKNNIESARSQTPDQRDVSYTGIAIRTLKESIEKKTDSLSKLKIEVEELEEQVKSQKRNRAEGLLEVEDSEGLLNAVKSRMEELAAEIKAESKNLADLQMDVNEVGKSIFDNKQDRNLPPS